MEQQIEAQEWSTNKKIVIFTLAGTIVLMSILATFVPTAREYVVSVVKLLMEFTKVFTVIK